MRTENRDKKDIQDAVNGMTYKFIKAIDEKGITTTYKELNKKIKLVLSESNFRKMITRLKKAIKDGKHEKLGRIRDRETGMSLQISQSQLLVHDILQKLSFDEKKFYSLDDAKEVSQNRSIKIKLTHSVSRLKNLTINSILLPAVLKETEENLSIKEQPIYICIFMH